MGGMGVSRAMKKKVTATEIVFMQNAKALGLDGLIKDYDKLMLDKMHAWIEDEFNPRTPIKEYITGGTERLKICPYFLTCSNAQYCTFGKQVKSFITHLECSKSEEYPDKLCLIILEE